MPVDLGDAAPNGRRARWIKVALGVAGTAAAVVVAAAFRRQDSANPDSTETDDWDECANWDDDEDPDEWDSDESLSIWDAADIWRSSGEDEGYEFGYDSDELRRAADSY